METRFRTPAYAPCAPARLLPRAGGIGAELDAALCPLWVGPIDADRHLRFLVQEADPEHVSFLQSPAWARVKANWRAESLGWFRGTALVGTALVLCREIPVLGRRSFAYIPEGPTVDWCGSGRCAADWIRPLIDYLRSRGVFSVKVGPKMVGRAWSARSVKAGMADPRCDSFADLPADVAYPEARRLVDELRALGWGRRASTSHGIADMQPRYFLRIYLRGQTTESLFAGFDAHWRRNVRTAERAEVRVWRASAADLPAFHAMYLETAARDGFTPRPLAYFQRMFGELLSADSDCIRLYLAGVCDVPSAGATMVRLGRHAWFGYGASTTARRDLRASNALQWQMLQDCLADGMEYYDLRGIGETLSADHPMYGLLRFKVGTGGEVVEYPGEYDYSLNRLLSLAMRIYLRFR